MQVTNANAHAAGKATEARPGASVERSKSIGADSSVTFSRSMSLPNGKTMTSERVVTRDGGAFSMHFEKMLPNGRSLVIDVTKTNAAEPVIEPPAPEESDPVGEAPQEASGDGQADADAGAMETPAEG